MAVQQLTCPTCGYQTSSATPGHVEYAYRRHSCTKNLAIKARREAAEQARTNRPVRECTCKQARHQHGDLAMYIRDKCRCTPCTKAVRRAEKLRRLKNQPAYVDAQPAIDHIHRLSQAGIGWVRASRLAGIPNGTVSRILYGHRGKPPTGRAHRDTVAKILAIPIPDITDLGARTPVPSHGTRRRLQALITQGWTFRALAREAGMQHGPLEMALQRDTTGAATAATVRDLYERLWNVPPPSATPAQRAAATQARNRARAAGWAPPAAYDDESLDDPNRYIDHLARLRTYQEKEAAAA